MTFTRVWPTGIGDGVLVPGAKLTQLDLNISRAVDGYNGGQVQPLAPIDVAGAGLKVSGLFDFPANAFNLGAPSIHSVPTRLRDLVAVGGLCIACADVDKVIRSRDSGVTWEDIHPGTPATITMRAVAMNGSGKAVAVGTHGSANVIYHSSNNGTSWSNQAAPASTLRLTAALYDPVRDQFVLAGSTGAAPRLLTADAADLTVWTSQTLPGSIAGTGVDAISLVQLPSGRLLATWPTQTGIAYSDDGVNWAVGTVLTSAKYALAVGKDYVLAYADDALTTVRYRSTDGATWSSVGMANCPITTPGQDTLACWMDTFVLHDGTTMHVSADAGASWVSVGDAAVGRTLSFVKGRGNRMWKVLHGAGGAYVQRSWLPILPGTP